MELHPTELHSVKNENKHKCSSCRMCIVLFSILFTINVGIGTYFVYFHRYLKKDVIRVKFGTHTETTIYECNSIELVNGKSQTNRDQKSNLLFL